MSTALEGLRAAYADRHAAARAFKAGGGQVVGYIGSDIPEEVIMAAGMLPVRLAAETGASNEAAEPYGEGGGNSIIRAFVARLLDGSYDYVDHLVIGATPSYLSALFVFLREIQREDPAFPRLPLHLFDFHHSDTVATTRFNRESVERLKSACETWSGAPIGDAALAAAIATCNANRAALAELALLRSEGAVSGVDALSIISAAYFMPKAAHTAMLRSILAEEHPSLPGRRVVFSGSETDTADLYRSLEAEGLLIVADDQGWGSRVAERAVPANLPPLDALTQRYQHMAPGPAKSSTTQRVGYLLDLVERSSADAVIFAIRGLDHPAAWDQPAQMAALKAAGIEAIFVPPETQNAALHAAQHNEAKHV